MALPMGVPATAFRTSYSREIADGTPEVSLTIRQLMLPGRVAAAFASPDGAGLALLRTMSAGFQDQNKISDNLTLQYGFTMDVVSFLDHLNYYSPYARLTYAVDQNDDLIVAYTSGDGRPDLGSGQAGDPAAPPAADNTLRRDIDALGDFPAHVAARWPHADSARRSNTKPCMCTVAARAPISASLYRQDISNAAMTMVAPAGFFSGGDVLPDLFSEQPHSECRQFQSTGVAVSATQNLGSNASATVIYGDIGRAHRRYRPSWSATTPTTCAP